MLRFRLITLMLLVTILCILLAPVAWWNHRAATQAAIIAELEEMGAVVSYDFEVDSMDGRVWFKSAVQTPDTIIVRSFGVARTCRVEAVRISGSTQHTDAFRTLGELKSIKKLVLEEGTITDDQAMFFERLPFLEDITLRSPKISDRTVKRLLSHKRLTALDLNGTAVTDQGVRNLATMPQLMILDLSFTKMTGNSIEPISHTHGLVELRLWGTSIGKGRLKPLIALKHLELLDVRETGVSEADVAELSVALPKLRVFR